MPDEIVTVEARVKDRIQRESYVGIHFQELQLESIFEDEAEEEKVTEASAKSAITITSSEQLRNLEAQLIQSCEDEKEEENCIELLKQMSEMSENN